MPTSSQTTSLDQEIFQELLELLKKQEGKFNLNRIKKAYLFAKNAHQGQFRMSGIPYICHPLETAKILASLEVDEATLIAGILHDVPEDTQYTVADVEKRFGKEVGSLVSALTKLSKVHYKHSMDDRQVATLRKLFLDTASDSRVVLVKLSDRLHNMKTIHYLRPEKQQRIARETLEIFAPLANLYGIHQLQRQLEDLCFKVLQPEEYARIQAFVRDHEKARSKFVEDTIKVSKKALARAGVKAHLEGRPKHFYSIYQKMLRGQKKLQDIYDYFAIRILVDKEETCYQALGIIHHIFKPRPGLFKDYIALPKSNGYQSLHTTVVGLQGEMTEIQIRTYEMHKNAEYGVAAHIHYKNNGRAFFLEGISLLKKYKNPEMFVRGLQEDVLQKRIFVFSPKGDLINLPEGATCLDYIFAVGLKLDRSILRVIVNNQVYSLTGMLQSGDRIEVIYGQTPNEGPERWWLEHVKTAKAKAVIKSYFARQSMETKTALGENLLQKEMDRENRGLVYQIPNSKTEALVKKLNLKDFAEVLSQIGEGLLSSSEIYHELYPQLQMGWFEFLSYRFKAIQKYFKVSSEEGSYRIRIKIESWDRVGLMKDLIECFYRLKIPILYWKALSLPYRKRDLEQRNSRDAKVPVDAFGFSLDYVDAKVETHEQLLRLFDHLQRVTGVMKVERFFKRNQIVFVVLCGLFLFYFLALPLLFQFFSNRGLLYGAFWQQLVIHMGLAGIFVILFWLRTMTNKTFPHFEETKVFWPISFFLTIFAIGSIFVNNYAYNLQLHLPSVYLVSLGVISWLFWTYSRHQKRRKHQLTKLKRAVDSSFKSS